MWRKFLILLCLSLPAESGFGQTSTPPWSSPIAQSVAFQPRGFREVPIMIYPSRESVTNDLRLLRDSGFRGLVTYGAMDVLGGVPEIARRVGFDGLIIMGIWDPESGEEINNALAQSKSVDGYCIGNEGLGVRYQPERLALIMAKFRKLTGKPVTTSERISRYLEGPDADWLIKESDWLFPIAHPSIALRRGGLETIHWIAARYDHLATSFNKKVILKEAGFPTAGAKWGSEDRQAEFFRDLIRTEIPFFFFEAFDQPYKRPRGDDPEVEHHWGLFRPDGTPKKVVRSLNPGAATK